VSSVGSFFSYVKDARSHELELEITILLIFESAQHVSGDHLPIFGSGRLWLQQCCVLS